MTRGAVTRNSRVLFCSGKERTRVLPVVPVVTKNKSKKKGVCLDSDRCTVGQEHDLDSFSLSEL